MTPITSWQGVNRAPRQSRGRKKKDFFSFFFFNQQRQSELSTALALPLLALGLQELPELQIRSPFNPHVLVPGRTKKKKKNQELGREEF